MSSKPASSTTDTPAVRADFMQNDPFYTVPSRGDGMIMLERAPIVEGVSAVSLSHGYFEAKMIRTGFFGQTLVPVVTRLTREVDGGDIVEVGGPTQHVTSFISDFFSKRKERIGGRINSTALVAHGPPGNGKTWACTRGIAEAQREHGAIVLTTADGDRDMDGWKALKAVTDKFRDAGIDSPIIWWVDDVPSEMWEDEDLEELLIANFDGRQSRDNVLLVATTNFGFNMPARFYNRPSRCSSVFFGPPTEQMLTTFFTEKGVPTDEIEDYVKASYGAEKTLDDAANLVFMVQATGLGYRGLQRQTELRNALANRKVNYAVASEILYGKLMDDPDAEVTLPDGQVINPTGTGTMDEDKVEDAQEKLEREIEMKRKKAELEGSFPGISRQELEVFVMDALTQGKIKPADYRGGRRPRNPIDLVRTCIEFGIE